MELTSTIGKYAGPIVRINPDEVHLDDPEILDVIFPGAGRRTNKPPVVGKRTGSGYPQNLRPGSSLANQLV